MGALSGSVPPVACFDRIIPHREQIMTQRARLVGAPATHSDKSTRPPLLFLAVLALLILCFFLAPWPFEQKAHAALQGLCAQRPSHSFTFDGRYLPFDGRMTGIYGGFLATSLYLGVRGRYRACGLPRLSTTLALGGLASAMAVDGMNSLLVDLRVWNPYEPRNVYRLLTGLGTGVVLAVAICFLLATTLWASGRSARPAIDGFREVGILAGLQVPFALAVMSGVPWLYVPVTLLLLIAALIAVAGLMLVVVVLLWQREGSFTSVKQMEGAATLALLLAIGVMAGIALARVLLERMTGAPPPM